MKRRPRSIHVWWVVLCTVALAEEGRASEGRLPRPLVFFVLPSSLSPPFSLGPQVSPLVQQRCEAARSRRYALVGLARDWADVLVEEPPAYWEAIDRFLGRERVMPFLRARYNAEERVRSALAHRTRQVASRFDGELDRLSRAARAALEQSATAPSSSLDAALELALLRLADGGGSSGAAPLQRALCRGIEAKVLEGADGYRRCPSSRPEESRSQLAWFTLAELDFAAQPARALAANRQVIAAAPRRSALRAAASFQSAVIQLRLDQPLLAARAFLQLLEEARGQRGSVAAALRRPALECLALALVEQARQSAESASSLERVTRERVHGKTVYRINMGPTLPGPKQVVADLDAFFEGKLGDPEVQATYQRVAELWAELSVYDLHVALARVVLERWPARAESPVVLDGIGGSLERERRYEQAASIRAEVVTRFAAGSSWARHNQSNAVAFEEGKRLNDRNLRRAILYHLDRAARAASGARLHLRHAVRLAAALEPRPFGLPESCSSDSGGALTGEEQEQEQRLRRWIGRPAALAYPDPSAWLALYILHSGRVRPWVRCGPAEELALGPTSVERRLKLRFDQNGGLRTISDGPQQPWDSASVACFARELKRAGASAEETGNEALELTLVRLDGGSTCP